MVRNAHPTLTIQLTYRTVVKCAFSFIYQKFIEKMGPPIQVGKHLKIQDDSLMKALVIIFLGGSLMLSNIACDAIGQNSKVLGKWECIKITKKDGREENLANYDKSMKIIEFFSDKTYMRGKISGNWIILEDGRMKMQDAFGNVTIGFIQGDKIISDFGDVKATYKRKM